MSDLNLRARVEYGPDKQLVLIDPMAEAVINELRLIPCRELLKDSEARVQHFVTRAVALGVSESAVIVVLDVDDPDGRALAEKLMPKQDELWQSFRDKGEKPVARGLAVIEGIPRELNKIPVLVMSDGTLLLEHRSIR